MAFNTSGIDPGAAPTTLVAVDTVAGAQIQRVKLVSGTEGDAGESGTDAAPLRVRARRRGTADYDSGNFAIAASAPVQITATTIYPEGGYIVNSTDVPLVVLLHDAGGAIIYNRVIAPHDTVSLPFSPGMVLFGWKAGADAAGARMQLWGGQ